MNSENFTHNDFGFEFRWILVVDRFKKYVCLPSSPKIKLNVEKIIIKINKRYQTQDSITTGTCY